MSVKGRRDYADIIVLKGVHGINPEILYVTEKADIMRNPMI